MSEQPLKGKIVMVTGATTGIGRVTAVELAKKGAHTVVVGRDRGKTEAVVAEIAEASGTAEAMLADLSSLQSIRELTDSFKKRHDKLDVLVNNAGAIFTRRELTADGF